MNKLGLRVVIFFVFIALSFSGASAFQRDFFVEQTLSKYTNSTLKVSAPFCNHESLERVEIVLSPVENIRSAKISEGDIFDFEVRKNVYYNNEILLLKGMKVKGKVETVTTQGMNGIPAIIMLNDFELPGIKPEKVKSRYLKKGLNLSYIVFPLKWALTFLPPTGSLTNFIVGGPAKVSKRNKIKLYYYPEWKCSEI